MGSKCARSKCARSKCSGCKCATASVQEARERVCKEQRYRQQACKGASVQGVQAGSAQARFPKGPWRSRRGITLTLRRSGLLTRKDMEAAGASPHAAEGNLGDESGSAPAPAPPRPPPPGPLSPGPGPASPQRRGHRAPAGDAACDASTALRVTSARRSRRA